MSKRLCRSVLAAVLVFAVAPAGLAGQKKKKKQAAQSQAPPLIPQSEQSAIEQDIGQMLGAFQIGDVPTMHKYYADDAVFVSGLDTPPLVGWQDYAASYERQHAAFQGMQIIRSNTLIFASGDAAWATYNWHFLGSAQGRSYDLYGHTTLVFRKTGGKWLITLNHSSVDCPQAIGTPPQAGGPAGNQTPAPQAH